MADKVAFELVSPEKLLLSTTADMVTVPGAEGDFGVMPGHQPLISTLRPGAIEVYEGDKIVERIFVAGGFAEVANDRLTVLAEEAMPFADLDRAKLEARLKDLREDLDDAKTDEAKARFQDQIDHLQQVLELI
jgi:F-type H+-transporting ATPase subunit epsilon